MQEYTSKDFYLCAYLTSEGCELKSFFRDRGFTTFIFDETEKLMELIRRFHSLSGTTEPVKYGHAIKTLKTLIHTEQISISKSDYNNQIQETKRKNN